MAVQDSLYLTSLLQEMQLSQLAQAIQAYSLYRQLQWQGFSFEAWTYQEE